MTKSPNGKIVVSLYPKIAYVWTGPKRERERKNVIDQTRLLAKTGTFLG